ncbi:CRISPR-associated helicase Cas3' [Herbivorax sp. ANBcel31]|uniref:CRISPR-associated helicase Cas3' n=1 Tax=Herbivorax sp. ANBcel31 TaxID=3069754 RepID=UPI0027B76002|nr:CRISPR-associated helicase Cas3' [Herbivorax sp. ANBcel31]MDQ2086773.1 CRISPR-associated helicase Cas3' [Herbivorax sp. ANBcel31]
MNNVMAKSRNSLEGIKEQKLTEHISDLLEIFKKIKTVVKFEEIIPEFPEYLRILCILHDLGKINFKFQKKIQIANQIDKYKKNNLMSSNNKDIKGLKQIYSSIQDERHNLLSGAFLKYFFDNLSISNNLRGILYKAIFFHHGSYEKYLSKSFATIEKTVFEDIEKTVFMSGEFDINEVDVYLKDKLDFSVKLGDDILDYEFLRYFNENFSEDIENKKLYILLKGFLNLIDHLASSQEKKFSYCLTISPEKLDNLLISNIHEKCKKNGQKIEKLKFNYLQKKISCLNNSNVITMAFTGSGKTVADYRWYGKRKIFLVPNKISSESFFFDAIDIFRNEDYVGLLHGDISLYVESFRQSIRGEDILFTSRDKVLAKNFAKPYIISTVDQILLSIFKYPGYEKICASIYSSHITVDEVHLLNPHMFLILMYFIEFASKYLKVKFHLMTATMPNIYLKKLNDISVPFVESNKDEDIDENRRIKLMFCGSDEWKDIICTSVRTGKKVLIIKNTIDEAMKTYEQLSNLRDEKIKINVLHSRFKFKHKKDKYKEILNQAGDVWISTQMVEISLDLDFQVIISDLAPMDALIQRMGRCNRHDHLEYGKFYIINKENKDVYNEKLKKTTKKALHKFKGKILSMKNRKNLLDNYYKDDSVEKEYGKEFDEAEKEIMDIYGLVDNSELNGENIMFKFDPYLNIVDSKTEASKLFRKIDQNAKVILESDYNNIKNNLEKYKEYSKNSIQISRGLFYKLNNIGAFYIEDGFLILKEHFCKYNQCIGLKLEKQSKDIEISSRIF